MGTEFRPRVRSAVPPGCLPHGVPPPRTSAQSAWGTLPRNSHSRCRMPGDRPPPPPPQAPETALSLPLSKATFVTFPRFPGIKLHPCCLVSARGVEALGRQRSAPPLPPSKLSRHLRLPSGAQSAREDGQPPGQRASVWGGGGSGGVPPGGGGSPDTGDSGPGHVWSCQGRGGKPQQPGSLERSPSRAGKAGGQGQPEAHSPENEGTTRGKVRW